MVCVYSKRCNAMDFSHTIFVVFVLMLKLNDLTLNALRKHFTKSTQRIVNLIYGHL